MTRVLAVSPHLDDAVFSAGGTLARLAAAGAQVTVATVFTATVPDPQGFALACQLDKGLGAEIDYMALRRAEDVRACAAIGAASLHLPFREAPHRGYASAAELFAGMRTDDGAVDAITPALRALIHELAPAMLFAPQAVGAHVDHVAVVHALARVGPVPPVAWWRDHPYAMRSDAPAEPFGIRFLDLADEEVALDASANAAKLAAALAYETQLGFQFGGPEKMVETFAAAAREERFRMDREAARRLLRVLDGSLGI